ncbi:glycosyltransferase [Arcobacter sp. YIC-464]|uniref:glycosyltransferase n=1 Tax=Arcobacter sp. YIC-464 TaxID=3376631 RepID=UPI003C1FA074
MKKLKVVQVLPELNEGGVERGTVESSREYIKRGIESIVISNGGKLVPQIEKDGGKHYTFDVCSKNIFTIFFRVFRLKKLLEEIKPDIIHVRSRVPAWLVYFANKELKIPFVTTVHGLNSVNKYSEIMTKGDEVICVSEVVKDYIVNNYNLDDSKFTVIQRGVDLNKFNPNNVDSKFIKNFKDEFNLNNKYIISSVGRVTWLKDYETFIKSIAIIKNDIPNVVGLIVGGVREDKKDYAQSLKELAKELDVEDDIIFTGSQKNIAEVYYLSDIVVNASLKMGNVGRTVVEALALNTPVIATTYEGLNNIVKDNINGAIIETKNEKQLATKILKVKDDSFESIIDTIPYEYTLNAMVESTINIYKRLTK